jgi:ketosteroid isomerase-like protein
MTSTQHQIGFLFASLLLPLLMAACESQPDSKQSTEQVSQAIRSVMERQQAAWNRGDIEGFMDGYERGETTTFVSGDDITRGWQTVLDRYKQRYNSPGLMGSLTFSELEVQPLGPSYALANGRWQLTRTNDTPHGRFSLIFRQTPSGWRIIQDTTTSATP